MQSGAVDTHCHLFLLDGDPAEAVEDARNAGVDTLVCVGIDPGSSRRSVELATSFPGVAATAGMHPHDASAFDAAAEAEIEELLANPLVVAVGECGLDFFRMRSPRPDQERALRAQVRLAKAYDLPLVIHVRDAWPEILRVLDEGSAERVVLHCFSGDAEIAAGCAERGWFLSFAGNVTYPKNEHLREAAAAVPLGPGPRRDRQPVPRATAAAWSRQRAVERRRRDRGDRARAGRTCGNREGNHRRERQNGLPEASVGPRNRRD